MDLWSNVCFDPLFTPIALAGADIAAGASTLEAAAAADAVASFGAYSATEISAASVLSGVGSGIAAVGSFLSPVVTGLSAVSSIARLAGGATQAYGTIATGNANRAALDNEAAQLTQAAGQTRASAQADAAIKRRAGAYAASKAQALQAAGGADPDSVTAVDNEINLTGQGEYNALTALYNGEEKARGMDYAAQNDLLKGQSAHDAGVIGAGNGLFNTLGGMYGNTLLSNNADPYTSSSDDEDTINFSSAYN